MGAGHVMTLNAEGPFSVAINTNDGSYNLLLDGNAWMNGYGPAVRQNNKWFVLVQRNFLLRSNFSLTLTK
jgi:hypothetical protein